MRPINLFSLAFKLAPFFISQPNRVQYKVLSDKDEALLNLKKKDGAVVAIVGTRGTGKTELAYRLAEFIGKPAYAVSPEQAPHPSFIERIGFDEIDKKVGSGSTILFDDVPVYLSNRDYHNQLVQAVERLIPMVRHEKKLHLIFVTQSSGFADKYVLDADAIFIKPGSLLFEDLERPGMKKLYQIANQYFEGKNDNWVLRHAYLITRQWQGILEIKKVT